MPDGNIHLIADNTDLELERVVEPHDAAIFEEELGAWRWVEADWPCDRDRAMFPVWLEEDEHSLVGGWLRMERSVRW